LLLKSTIQVTLFSFLGIILNFLTQFVVAFYFGATPQRDAYFAASVIPTYITALFVGSFGSIFMSAFIRQQTKKTDNEIRSFTGRILNICGLFLIILVAIGILFAKQIISFLDPGFNGNQLLFTSKLLRILLPTIIFLTLSNLLTTIYQANKRFLLPAAVPVISVVITLLFVYLISNKIGIESLAYGTLFASIFSFVVLSTIIFKNKLYCLSFKVDDEFLRALRISLPLLAAGIFYKSTNIIERMIASTLEPGSISYLGYANQLMNVLSSIAAGGIATTIYPLMTREWELNNFDDVRIYFVKGIRTVLLVTLPIAAIFIVLGNAIVKMLLQRGAFTNVATNAVTNCLIIMMLAFVSLSCGNIVAKGFYISNKTKIFSIIASSEIMVYLLLGYYLSRSIHYLGLAVALSVSSTYGIILSFYILSKIFDGLNEKKLVLDLIKIVSSSIIAGSSMFLAYHYIITYSPDLLRLILSICIGLIFYVIFVVYLFQLVEVSNLKIKVIFYIKTKIQRIVNGNS